MTSEKNICTQCLLTEDTPGISFDANGMCNFCRDYIPIETSPESELSRILDHYRNSNSKYDCMVGLSGGRDSTYVLWKLVNDHKMNVLAVTYDNPFASEQAKINIDNALTILGVDGVKWGFPEGAHYKATKKHLKIWSHNPSSAMIPFVCSHCKTWWPGFFNVARANGISLVVIGSNPLETASFKKAGFGGARTYHKLANIPKVISKSARELFLNPYYLSADWKMVFKMYLGASHSTPFMKWRFNDINVLRFFDYIQWNEKDVESTISKNLGWEKSPDVASGWRFDCKLDYVRRLMYTSTVGITELRDLFSKMIRAKQITREDAICRLEQEDSISLKIVEEVLSNLDLELSDLNLNLDKEYLI